MLLRRRAIALLMSVLTLQLTLAGELTPCADAGGGTSAIGMDMAGMGMAGMDMPADTSDAPLGGTDCDAMLACAPAVVSIVADVAPARVTRHSSGPVTGALLSALTRTTAPDFPPPRA